MNNFIWPADATADASQEPSSSLQCSACGRNFTQTNAYSTHTRSCQSQKKRLASALDLAKEKYRRKKVRLNESPALQQPLLESNLVEATVPSIEVWASKNHVAFLSELDDLT